MATELEKLRESHEASCKLPAVSKGQCSISNTNHVGNYNMTWLFRGSELFFVFKM